MLDIIACMPPLDAYRLFGTPGSCACPDQVWFTTSLGTLVFAILYLSALFYKVRLSDDIYAVHFRYQTSFTTLMTVIRTGTQPCQQTLVPLVYMCIFPITSSTRSCVSSPSLGCGLQYLTTVMFLADPAPHAMVFRISGIINLVVMTCLLRYNYKFQPVRAFIDSDLDP
jgi:hypothetical protein